METQREWRTVPQAQFPDTPHQLWIASQGISDICFVDLGEAVGFLDRRYRYADTEWRETQEGSEKMGALFARTGPGYTVPAKHARRRWWQRPGKTVEVLCGGFSDTGWRLWRER